MPSLVEAFATSIRDLSSRLLRTGPFCELLNVDTQLRFVPPLAGAIITATGTEPKQRRKSATMLKRIIDAVTDGPSGS